MPSSIAIATVAAVFGVSFCTARFWPQPVAVPPIENREITQIRTGDAIAAPVADIITPRSLADAATGCIKISPQQRDRLRFGAWARREPRAAFAAVLDPENRSLVGDVITTIAETDPYLALELARGAEDRTLSTFFIEIFHAWPGERLVEASDELLVIYAGIAGTTRLDRLRKRHLLKAATGISERWPADETADLIRWTSLLYCDEYRPAQDVISLVSPRKVDDLAFISSIGNAKAQAIAATYIASSGSLERGIQALQLVPISERAHPIYFIAEKMAANDPAGALRFLDQQIAYLVREDAPAELVDRYGSTDLEKKIHAGIKDGRIDRTAYQDLPMPLRKDLELGRTSIADEAAWTATARDEAPSRSVAFDVAARWTRGDPTAAAEWLGTLEDGGIRDHSIAGFVREHSRHDPAAATIWAAEIIDPQLRDRFMRVALRRWKAANPEAAIPAIRQSGLPEIAVESLLRE